jgi:hypothetical protein
MGGDEYLSLGLLCGGRSVAEILWNENVLMSVEQVCGL